MLTRKGLNILLEIEESLRQDYHDSHPGSNENDAERDFLKRLVLLLDWDWDSSKELRKKIEEIR
jgi:hypothetical protein